MRDPQRDGIGEGDAGGSGGRSLVDLLTLLSRERRLLIGLPLLTAIAAVVFSLFMRERYTVESRFMPETNRPQASQLAGLAAQFGVDIGGAEGGETVDFYAELLESPDLLRSAVLSDYRFGADGDTMQGNLVELLGAGGRTQDEKVHNAVKQLGELVEVRPDPAAKLVTVRTSAPWPELAVDVNERLLGLLSEFNLERRQSRAAAERQFLEARVTEAANELRSAEATLERFLSENRRYGESPQLSFEHSRLERRVALQQQLYTSLAQGFEQARLDEVRNTPVITVIDQPRGPADKTAPKLPVNAFLGLLLGLFLALTIVIVRELLRTLKAKNPERYEELRATLPFRGGRRAAAVGGRPAAGDRADRSDGVRVETGASKFE